MSLMTWPLPLILRAWIVTLPAMILFKLPLSLILIPCFLTLVSLALLDNELLDDGGSDFHVAG